MSKEQDSIHIGKRKGICLLNEKETFLNEFQKRDYGLEPGVKCSWGQQGNWKGK